MYKLLQRGANMYGIILAGGSGSRLWPLSRELYPKQLLNIMSDKSLLQSTFERLTHCMDKSNILSITNTKHASNVKMQIQEFLKQKSAPHHYIQKKRRIRKMLHHQCFQR